MTSDMPCAMKIAAVAPASAEVAFHARRDLEALPLAGSQARCTTSVVANHPASASATANRGAFERKVLHGPAMLDRGPPGPRSGPSDGQALHGDRQRPAARRVPVPPNSPSRRLTASEKRSPRLMPPA